MAKTKQFNKIMAIAPSRILESGIDINRYSDRIADIYYGYDVEQLALIDGYTKKGHLNKLGRCSLRAVKPLQHISKRLQEEYKIPAKDILLYRGSLVDMEQVYADDTIPVPQFFQETKEQNRTMALIADEQQMSFGRKVMSTLTIQPREFQVLPPRFSVNGVEVSPLQSPSSLDAHRSAAEVEPALALTGDN